MEHATIIGIDLAKRSFQLHGARADGSVAFRRKLSRNKVLDFVGSQPRCVVAMEACASSHHWGREIGKLGHAVKLVPPIYVKPANAPMGQSMRTRTVSPRRRHCRYSTAARSKSPVCIGRAGLRHRRERRSPCGATSAVLSSPLRFLPARFSAPPLPRGPSSRTAGHPVPASRRGSAG